MLRVHRGGAFSVPGAWRRDDPRDWASASVAARQSEEGQIGLLILCFTAVVLALVVCVVNVTAVQLARARVYDACDAAALDAADEIASGAAYRGGIGSSVPVSSDSVRASAVRHLASVPHPDRVTGWVVTGRTGSPDGAGAHVEVAATVELPMFDSLVSAVAGRVTFTVASDASARVTQ